jgi:hypothetical protein
MRKYTPYRHTCSRPVRRAVQARYPGLGDNPVFWRFMQEMLYTPRYQDEWGREYLLFTEEGSANESEGSHADLSAVEEFAPRVPEARPA